jgi:beta-lactamase regulating signal transducer with metallopeptidase domain
MGTIFIYLLKVNGLIAVFYLAYYFLVQKETFFNSNRWFLLSGLLTSVLMPLFFVTKVILVEKTPKIFNAVYNTNSKFSTIPEERLDWNLIISGLYLIVIIILLLFIFSNLYSFFKLINNKKVEFKKPFALVDIRENINPFSFFKYIVFNSDLYSKVELENILNHEKVHSREKHSIDVLIAKVFCAVFWFNPFIWLYKKAILQNLEYIADQKAIQNIEDKKAYQMTLLRVVTDQNCLLITNNFYQSLIKKRIVMLNKSESKKSNLWKYTIVIPVLVAFVALFQMKVIAQEKTVKQKDGTSVTEDTKEIYEITFNKKDTNQEIKKVCNELKTSKNVDLVLKSIKRNSNGEITAISLTASDNEGTNTTYDVNSDEPIVPFIFVYSKDLKGKTEIAFHEGDGSSATIPKPPTPPTVHSVPSLPPSPPTPPKPPRKPATKEMKRAKSDIEKSKVQIEKAQKYMAEHQSEIENAQKEVEKARPEIEKAQKYVEEHKEEIEIIRKQIEESKPELEKAKKLANQARKEAMLARKDAENEKYENDLIAREKFKKAKLEAETKSK